MKKLVLPIVLVTGLLCLVPGKVNRSLQTSGCHRLLPEKEILLPVERLLWWPRVL